MLDKLKAILRRAGPSNSTAHNAEFGDTLFLYTFAFDVGVSVPYDILAAKLLDAGIAETAVVAGSEEVRLAPRYAKLANGAAKMQTLLETNSFIQGRVPFSDLSWASKFLAAWLSIRHYPAYIWRRLRGVPTSPTTNETDSDAFESEFGHVVDEASQKVASAQVLAAAHSAVDRQLYFGSYLAREPYYRLTLHSVNFSGAQPPMRDHLQDDENVEVELLLHRSGVALLTFVVGGPARITADQISTYTRADRVQFNHMRLPSSVVTAYLRDRRIKRRNFVGRFSDEMIEGQTWVDITGSNASDVTDLFAFHLQAISHFAGVARTDSWLCFPNIFVDHVVCACRDREEWNSRHSSELDALLGGLPASDHYDLSALTQNLSRDHSISRYDSFYAPGGFTLEVNWLFDRSSDDDLFSWFFRTTVVENALLQYWQTVCLDAAVTVGSSYSERKVAETLTAFTFGLEELRGSQFAYGTANELSSYIFAGLRGPEVQQRLENKTSELKDLSSARSSLAVARRSARLSTAALLAAVTLGLPAIQQSLDIIRRIDSLHRIGSILLSRLPIDLAPEQLPILVYGVFVLLVVLVFATRRRASVRIGRVPQRRKKVGIGWPGTNLTVEIESTRPGGPVGSSSP